MMEYTTPPSYGSTTVNVGAILKDDEVVYAGTTNKATHTASETDPDSEWPQPTSIKWEWTGKTADGQEISAEVDGALGKRLDRVDVMGEVPGFIKAIAGSVAGTRPYIFQVGFTRPLLFTYIQKLTIIPVLAKREAFVEAVSGWQGDGRGGLHVLRVDLHLVESVWTEGQFRTWYIGHRPSDGTFFWRCCNHSTLCATGGLYGLSDTDQVFHRLCTGYLMLLTILNLSSFV